MYAGREYRVLRAPDKPPAKKRRQEVEFIDGQGSSTETAEEMEVPKRAKKVSSKVTENNAVVESASSDEEIVSNKKPRKKKKSSYADRFNITLHSELKARFENSFKIDGDVYKCKECGFECIREARIRAENHMEWHSKVLKPRRKKGEEKIKCCGNELGRVKYYEHVKEMHPEEVVSKPFKCFKCKKSISTRKLLRQHLNDHNTNFGCDVCGCLFSRKAALEYHVSNIHSIKNQEGKDSLTVNGRNSFVDNMVILGAAEQRGGDVGEKLNAF
jgi:hypothetical protein